NHFFNVICNKYLVIIKLDGSFDGIVFGIDSREIQDSFQVKRIIHIQMDPEQWLLIIQENLAVKFLIILIAALIRMFCPQWMDIADGYRTLLDLYLLLGRFYFYHLFFAVFIFFFFHFSVFMNMLDHYIVILQIRFVDGLILWFRIFFGQENLYRHKGAVFLQYFSDTVFIGKLQAVIILVQGHL